MTPHNRAVRPAKTVLPAALEAVAAGHVARRSAAGVAGAAKEGCRVRGWLAFLAATFPDLDPTAVTAAHIEAYLLELAAAGQTTNVVLSVLRQLYDWLTPGSNPARQLHDAQRQVSPARPRSRRAEVDQMLDAGEARAGRLAGRLQARALMETAVVAVICLAGATPGEVRRLTTCDVDLAAGRLALTGRSIIMVPRLAHLLGRHLAEALSPPRRCCSPAAAGSVPAAS